ncbi:hypothetical protein TrLO_g15769 [Triparma laevis f. longispina]|uniref:Thioredoxin domain-containing protein n=1 Tax=Triparma laevis f. longispina TaxID=1714387 RepID=A0A9W7FER2_9STRA|nr:hypothetical protein TrLO_g15769 [Triparma laevis f. longispina]
MLSSLRSLLLSSLLLSLLPPTSTSTSSPRRQNNIDFWPTPHLQTYLSTPQPHDACILFYAPWSTDSQSFAPLFERIGEIVKAGLSESNLLMVYFDCEQDKISEQICEGLGVKKYPEIMYLGRTNYYSNDLISSLTGSKSGHERMAVFKGDWRFGEEVRDFIYLMRSLGKWGVWEDGVGNPMGWFGGRGEGGKEIGVEDVKSDSGSSSSDGAGSTAAAGSTANPPATSEEVNQLVLENAELETLTNQAAVLMESLLMSEDSDADVFKNLMETGGWDNDELLRNCVIDLSLDYCTRVVNKMDRLSSPESKSSSDYEDNLMEELSDLEPYCAVFDECVRQDFPVNSICRPNLCPFNKEMGCRYVGSCGGELLREEYGRMMKESGGEQVEGEVGA